MNVKLLAVVLCMCLLLSGCSSGTKTSEGINAENTSSYVTESTNIVKNDVNGNIINNEAIPYYGYTDYYDVLPDRPSDDEFSDYCDKIYYSSDQKYRISDYGDGVCINEYLGQEDDLVIPDTIDGKKVIKLGGIPLQNDGNDYLFYTAFHSYAIKTVKLPKYLNEIVDGVFQDNSMKNRFDENEDPINNICYISVSEDNQWYSAVNGILYNKDQTILLEIPRNYSKNTVELNKNLSSIDVNCNISENLTTVKGYRGTAAETFAKEHNLEFVALD